MNLKYLLPLFLLILVITPALAQTINGTVYLDKNQNLQQDRGESGIANVLISNGHDVVKSDARGNWKIEAQEGEIVFLIKPSEYHVPATESMLPQHYHIIREAKQQVSFPLWTGEKKEAFEALIFSDTQTRGIKEVNYMTRDVVEECIGTNAKFGITLGDIVADEPWLFDEIAESTGTIGIPWYYVYGNHDREKGMKGNKGAEDDFIKNFGPANYAFQYGKTAFISLNNVDFKDEGGYRAYFSDNQLKFVDAYLKHVPDDHLVVLFMHIPIIASHNRDEMYRLLEKRSHVLTVSGHTHELANVFIGKKDNWNGNKPLHLFVNGTVSGSWWCGTKDELGIPHATMNDGAPNGYAIIRFEGNQYNIQYKAARRPADYQMNIYLPDEISLSALDTTSVLVNIFNGSEKSQVSMQLDNKDGWITMEQTVSRDPACLAMHEVSKYLDAEVEGKKLDELFGWKMDYPSKSHHFWKTALPRELKPGTHKLTVQTTDMYGNTYIAHRVFRVME